MDQNFIEIFHYGFIQTALCACVLIALNCGLLSPIVVMKERAYLSDTLSHLIFPGVILGFLCAKTFGLPVWGCVWAGATLTALFGTYISEWLLKTIKIPPDASAVIALSAFFALGVTIISNKPHTRFSPEALLFGDALTLDVSDLYILSGVLVAVFICVFTLKTHWNAWLADSEFSTIAGFKTTLLERIFPLLLTITVLSGLFTVGGLMISALITLPALICQPKQAFSVPVVLTSVTLGLFGALISFTFNLPVGPSIVLLGFAAVMTKALLVRLRFLGS